MQVSVSISYLKKYFRDVDCSPYQVQIDVSTPKEGPRGDIYRPCETSLGQNSGIV